MAELETEEEQRPRRFPTGAVVATGVAAALGAVAFSRTRQRARLQAHEQALRELAEELGGEFTPAEPGNPAGPDFPSLVGTYHQHQVRVDTEVAGNALNYRFLTRATASHGAAVEGFVVVREETPLTRAADHLGLADVQVGEPAFDDRFEVIADQDAAARILPPEVRDALLGAQFESVVIRADEVTVRQYGPVAEAESLRQSLRLAVDIAELLETLG